MAPRLRAVAVPASGIRAAPRATALTAVAVAVGLTIAGCNDDDTAAPPDSPVPAATDSGSAAVASAATSAPADTAAAAPPPDAGTATGAAEPATEDTGAAQADSGGAGTAVDELQAAVDAYDAAYTAATAAPGDPASPALLEATTDGVLRDNVQAVIANRQAAGQALRPGRAGIVLDWSVDEVVSSTPTEAVVRACYFDAAELYVVATGEVVDDTQVAGHDQILLVKGDDGRWRVDSGGPVGDEAPAAVNPCA